jgi:hypothetical protein
MEKFNPPGRVNDFSVLPPPQAVQYADAWNEIINHWLDKAVRSFQTSGGVSLFYNPSRDATPGNADAAAIGWDAFPKVLSKWFENDEDRDRRRWETAEILSPDFINEKPLRRVENGTVREAVSTCYRQQDEYCEWFVDRDEQTGNIRRISFTSEGPEYWRFLATGTRTFFDDGDPRQNLVPGDRDVVTELYRRYVNQNVRTEDLFWNFDVAYFDEEDNGWRIHPRMRRGDYNPYNKWNSTHGCMHLTHPANTLQAEINLAAKATLLRQKASGEDVTDITELICCSNYGEVNRSSDPSIGASVNEFARQGFSVSLADPIGLYISNINLGAFAGPNGENVRDAWHVARGSDVDRMILRAHFELPQNTPFTINDVRISGVETRFGGQLADHIQMILTGLAKNRNVGAIQKIACETKCCTHPQKPDFRKIIRTGGDCNRITLDAWQSQAPLMTPSPFCEDGAAGFGAELDEDFDAAVKEIAVGDLPVEDKTRNTRRIL